MPVFRVKHVQDSLAMIVDARKLSGREVTVSALLVRNAIRIRAFKLLSSKENGRARKRPAADRKLQCAIFHLLLGAIEHLLSVR